MRIIMKGKDESDEMTSHLSLPTFQPRIQPTQESSYSTFIHIMVLCNSSESNASQSEVG